MANLIMDKWFYICGIPGQLHSDKGQSFENAIIEHLYTMHEVKQLKTRLYNMCGNSTCKRFNHRLRGLLKTLDKGQKSNWPLQLSSLVFAYIATPHSVTGYQPYELMISCKAPNVCDAWLWLAKYNEQYFQRKSAWVNEQHKLILAGNRSALKSIKQTAKKRVLCVGGSPLSILRDNLVLLRDHPEGKHKIHDNYKSELFMIVSKHKDPNVYTIHPLCVGSGVYSQLMTIV